MREEEKLIRLSDNFPRQVIRLHKPQKMGHLDGEISKRWALVLHDRNNSGFPIICPAGNSCRLAKANFARWQNWGQPIKGQCRIDAGLDPASLKSRCRYRSLIRRWNCQTFGLVKKQRLKRTPIEFERGGTAGCKCRLTFIPQGAE